MNSEEEKLRAVSETLDLFGERVTFASSRIEIVQSATREQLTQVSVFHCSSVTSGQVARRDALMRIQRQQETPASENEAERDEPISERFAPEMERLRRERDSLSKQCRDDALAFELRVTESCINNHVHVCQARRLL